MPPKGATTRLPKASTSCTVIGPTRCRSGDPDTRDVVIDRVAPAAGEITVAGDEVAVVIERVPSVAVSV